MTLYVDPSFAADELRRSIFRGDLVVLTRLEAVSDLVAYMQAELAALFAPHDPERIHQVWSPEEMAPVLGDWKPAFMHSPRAQELVRAVVAEAGMSPETTYFDVPKPRTSFPVGHLNTGIAFAFPWHRDAWYSAPPQQINWWLPVFPAREDNAMGFDLAHFARAAANNSRDFDYYHHNAQRHETAKQVTAEVQARPGAYTHETDSELVVLPPPGGVLLFSGAQLHRSTPNTSPVTRYSIDFRTVDASDVEQGLGAPLVDCECTGTSIRDFTHPDTGLPLPEELVTRVFGRPPADAMLVYGQH